MQWNTLVALSREDPYSPQGKLPRRKRLAL